MSAGNLRKLWDSLLEMRSSLCERRLAGTVLRPALLSVKTAQFTAQFDIVIAQFNLECIGHLRQ